MLLRAADEQRVTVGRGPCRRRGADHGARSDAVLDDELLPELRRQPLGCDSTDEIEAAPGRVRGDDLDRAIGIILGRRRRGGEAERERGKRPCER